MLDHLNSGPTVAKAKKAEREAARMISYSRHVDENTIATKDGDLLQVLKVEGLAFETMDPEEVRNRLDGRNILLRAIGNSRLGLHHHIIRRRCNDYPPGAFKGFAKDLDDAWRARLAAKEQFVNDQYVTLCLGTARGPGGAMMSLKRLLSKNLDRTLWQGDMDKDLKLLNELTDKVIDNLGIYGVRRLGVEEDGGGQYSELLSFFFYLLNQEQRKVRLPSGDLSEYLAEKRIFFGKETLELHGVAEDDVSFGAILAIKEYAASTQAGLLDNLMRLPFELVISQSYLVVERLTAQTALKMTGRRMDNAEDAAESLRLDLIRAEDDVASGRINFGKHQINVLVKANSQSALSAAVSQTHAALGDLGIISVREDTVMEFGYWSLLPGNFRMLARGSLISSLNFAGFASLHGFPKGKLKGNHWGDCVTLLETTSGTPYAFNFHHGDLANFIVIGPSGSGKTVFLNFVLAQAQRLKPRCVFFDKDRGAELFLRALGGDYRIIEPGKPAGFNPLQLPDTKQNRAFIREFIATLLRPSPAEGVSPEDKAVIAAAVDTIFIEPPEDRRLALFAQLLEGQEVARASSLSARFAPWHSGGEYAWLFDNPVDEIHFDNPVWGLDMSHILDQQITCTPVLMYLFHRIDAILDGQPTMIFIDEGWKALGDPAFKENIKDWLKTIRKRNGLIGFGSQSAGDVLASGIGETLVEQSPTQIFMPNMKADKKSYCEGFGLTEMQYELVRTLPDDSRCFIVKHGNHAVIARLDLSGMDGFIRVLSGRTQTVRLAEEIRREVGEDPADWLPVFYERSKAVA